MIYANVTLLKVSVKTFQNCIQDHQCFIKSAKEHYISHSQVLTQIVIFHYDFSL